MSDAQPAPASKNAAPKDQPGVANQQKNPEEWVTGSEPMTGAQASYLKTLTEQAGSDAEFDGSLNKAQASERIDELRKKAGIAAKPS